MSIVAHDDRDALHGHLEDHYLRIGDSQFMVPPTSIQVHRQMKHERVAMIRGRSSMPVESGYFDRIITIPLFFPNMDAINNELRPLLAQAKKCPFLPVENTLLNEAHKVEAITIQHVSVQQVPGFPHSLEASIQCYVFEPATYIYGTSEKSFDEMFNWPLFRWYYQRNLKPTSIQDEGIGHLHNLMREAGEEKNVERNLMFFEPLLDEMSNDYIFRIASEDDLKMIREWRLAKRDLVKQWMEDKREGSTTTFKDYFTMNIENIWTERTEDQFNKEYNDLWDKAIYEYDIHYETWDLGELTLQGISASFENSITSHQLQMHQSPSHQYMGSQDIMLKASFVTRSMETVASFENLMRRVSYLTREYHQEVANGFLEFDHQLARLFSVKNVVIDDVNINTVEDQPGLYQIDLSLMAYSRAERKSHEVKAMTQHLDWDIPINDISTPLMSNLMRSFREMRNGVPLDADEHKRAIYDAWVQETFKAVELYPDLELPTYSEVTSAGFDIPNMNDGLFVDPDFFIVYDADRDLSFIMDKILQQSASDIDLYDASGGQATISGSGTELNEKALQVAGEAESISKIKEPKIEAHPDISNNTEQKNYSTADMESLIRKSASMYGLPDHLVMAFLKSMDPKLQHFYKVGQNPDFGINTPHSNMAIRQKSDFSYTTSADVSYIGVMRNNADRGDSHQLKSNVEYNVDIGMRYMIYYHAISEYMLVDGDLSIDKLYKTFNLSMGSSGDSEKVQFIATLFMYLGLERELSRIVEKGQEPSKQVLNFMNNVLNQIDKTKAWSFQKIQDEYDDLPVKDYKAKVYEDQIHETINDIDSMDAKAYEDKENIHKGMMHDMLKYDRRGRLVRAFPTFFLTFVDEGEFIGNIKMSDQYFNYKAISDITYNNSRKEASSTLICQMSNVFNSLNDNEKSMDLGYSSWMDFMNSIFFPGIVARETEQSRQRDPNFYNSIYLRTGVRVHFRMGYGSNPINMPTIMNGTITSLTDQGDMMTMVCQDDGIELVNKINEKAGVSQNDDTSGFMSTKKEPTEILDELLTGSEGFFSNIASLFKDEQPQNHSLGIMHFGATGLPQGLQDFQDLFTLGLFEGRERREINMNVYQTTGLLEHEHKGFWASLKDGLGIGETDEAGINMNLYGKTVWDVLNINASIGSDMITAVHPFGLRSTMFLGKPYFPLHYDYDHDEDKKVQGTKVKTFKQMHVYDSYTSIISNQIQATEENMYTVASGTYMNEGKRQTTPLLYVDTHIWPEKQKTVNIDTMMNAKGVWAFDKLPLIGDFLNKPFKWHYDENVAIKITAAGLRDYVKDMYDGYLTVTGDPSVKPYDGFLLQDYYSNMSGPADVKEVVHIMNHQEGFISMIKPDVIAYNSDQEIFNATVRAVSVAASATATIILRAIANSRGYTGNLPILNGIWGFTQKKFSKMKNSVNETKMMKKAKEIYKNEGAHFQGRVKEFVNEKVSDFEKRNNITIPKADIDRAKANGIWNEIVDKLDGFDKNEAEKMLTKGTKWLDGGAIQKGMKKAKLDKLKKPATSVLAKGAGSTSKLLKGSKWVGMAVKGIWKGKHALLGPVGILTFAVESAVVHGLTSTVSEFVDRSLITRQAVIIVPLKKDGIRYLAGVNGHKGSVAGDTQDTVQSLATSLGGDIILGLFGVETSKYETPEMPDEITDLIPLSSGSGSSSKASTLSPAEFLSGLIPGGKGLIEDDGRIEKDYLLDVEMAKADMKGRVEWLEKIAERNVLKDYSIFDQLDDGFFSSLFSKLFSGGDSSGDCGGGVPLTGKAVNLSQYFDVLGPKIDKEAKSQGLSQYAELLKAKCMQESGGNYKRYPDVFQASESLGLPVNSIGLERSIKQGVKYFNQVVEKANGDIRLALQSYNYGSGFINYVNDRGGEWTQDLANEFSDMMAKKKGWRRYGDKNYVKNVLRYYEYDEADCTGGASDAPEVTGGQGQDKYHLSHSQAKSKLIDASKQSDRAFNLTLVGSSSTSLMRKGTYELTNKLAKEYKKATGQKIVVTSAFRTNDPRWHGTGYAIDIDTPNTMRRLSGGKLGFPNGKDKDNARTLMDKALSIGFDGVVFGDWFLGQEMKKKYKGMEFLYRPEDHHNHLHLSYPTKGD